MLADGSESITRATIEVLTIVSDGTVTCDAARGLLCTKETCKRLNHFTSFKTPRTHVINFPAPFVVVEQKHVAGNTVVHVYIKIQKKDDRDFAPNMTLLGLWFLACYATTPLATQLQQRRIKVVRSNKVAQKHLTESNGTPAMDLAHFNVVLK